MASVTPVPSAPRPWPAVQPILLSSAAPLDGTAAFLGGAAAAAAAAPRFRRPGLLAQPPPLGGGRRAGLVGLLEGVAPLLGAVAVLLAQQGLVARRRPHACRLTAEGGQLGHGALAVLLVGHVLAVQLALAPCRRSVVRLLNCRRQIRQWRFSTSAYDM